MGIARTTGRVLWWTAVLASMGATFGDALFAAANEPKSALASDIDLYIGGVGGVYFLAEPGEFWVEVEKRDRNRRDTRTELRAILVGPDRQVLQEATILDDNRPRGSGVGPPQRCRLATKIEAKGIHVLNVTVSQDRYGEEMVWGFRSNCRKYLIETARGHKDERHQEPIVLASPERPTDVCFLPRKGAFDIEVSGLPKGSPPWVVFDGQNKTAAKLAVDANGRAAHQFAAGLRPGSLPWRLHFPKAQATLSIDGVTRWDGNDACPDIACWTPEPSSWFPWLENRWLLTPYSRKAHCAPGETCEVEFRVHNNADRPRTVQIALEFPDREWDARLSAERISLGANKAATVSVRCGGLGEGQRRVARIRATPLDDSGFSTYSTLTVTAVAAPATTPPSVPVLLKPYQHENEQFAYLPGYPLDNQVYFDLRNRPFITTSDGLASWDGKWTESRLSAAVKSCPPSLKGKTFRLSSTKVAFDRDNDLYLLANAGGVPALLHSTDNGRTFAAYEIPPQNGRSCSFDIEQFSGHNVSDGPPPFVRFTQTARDEKLIWRRLNDLELFTPEKENGRLTMGEPVLLSERCIGLSAHSGIPGSVVSRGNKIHVAWGEATDPKAPGPGVPAYVATYDRATGTHGEPALVAYGPPANDVHNSPSITMDSQGFLHVLAGTHGRPFPYAKSLKPNDAQGGWTEAAPTGDNLRQTYIGLVCGSDDTLHAVFRMWRSGVEPFPASHHATLAYQRKRPGQPWEPPRILIVAPFSEYSIFYHRFTIDRKGRLFLSYDYWSTYWFYRNDHFGSRRALLMSPDGGDTWKLTETKDLK